ILRDVGLPVQFETPFQMRIVRAASFWPSRPNDKQRNEERGIRIGSLQTKFPNNVFHSRIFVRAQPLSAFRTEYAVVGNVCATISAELVVKPPLAADKTQMPFLHARLAPA